MRWCVACRKAIKPGEWVPHARLMEWGYRWVDEVPAVPFDETQQERGRQWELKL